MTESEKIGLFIKKRRKALGMTQEDLTTKVGYKVRGSINKIENGLSDIPPNKLQKFAAVLNCDICSLVPYTIKNIKKGHIGEVENYISHSFTVIIEDTPVPNVNDTLLNSAFARCALNYQKQLLLLESEILELQNKYDNKIRASYLMICDMLKKLDKPNNHKTISNFYTDLQSIDTTDIKQLNDLRQKYKLD